MSSTNLSSEDEGFLRQAIELSRSAIKHGNEPFGACLVSKSGELLLTAENTIHVPVTDATCHAETNLVRLATQKLQPEILKDCTLYTSTEPCLMCTGAIQWSGVRRIIYCVSKDTLLNLNGPDCGPPCKQFLQAPEYTVIGPVLEEEGAKVHQAYWNK